MLECRQKLSYFLSGGHMSRRIFGVIAAACNGGLYGVAGGLPWEKYENKKLSADLKHFKEVTSGHVLIMGRGTWDSFTRGPLPNRMHIVVTSNPPEGVYPNVYFVSSFKEALKLADEFASDKNVFFIGGEKIWEAGLLLANTVYITEVWKTYRLDNGAQKSFPDLRNLRLKYPSFEEIQRVAVRDCPSGINYDLVTFSR